MRARIKEKREVAHGTLLVSFDLQGGKLDYRPGQYFLVKLIDPPYTDERGARRHFSIVSTPAEQGIITMTTRVRESAFKRSLNEMPVGAEAEVGPVAGDFVLPENPSQPLVFVAGGIGITPFFSMIRHVKEQRLGHKITLLYSNRDRESTAFLDELQALAREMRNLKLVLTMTADPDWPGEKRRIDAQFIRDHVADPPSCRYMIAGPGGMNEAMEKAIREAGVPRENIAVEVFTGY